MGKTGNNKDDLQYWKDKSITLQNMLIDISNIIEKEKNPKIILENVKEIYKENKWDI